MQEAHRVGAAAGYGLERQALGEVLVLLARGVAPLHGAAVEQEAQRVILAAGHGLALQSLGEALALPGSRAAPLEVGTRIRNDSGAESGAGSSSQEF